MVSIGLLITTMDAGGLAIALPTFTQVFGEPPETVLWVILGYSLVYTGFTLTAGRLSDMLGRRLVLTVGFVILVFSLLAASLAPDLWPLVAARAFHALGGAIVIGTGPGIIAEVFPDRERGRALGLLESVVGAGLMFGPVVGGLLLDSLGWRAIFYVRVPLAALGALLAWRVLRDGERPATPPRFDIGGSVTLFLALSALMLAINRGHSLGWISPAILGLAALSIASGAAFFTIQRRITQPVIDLGLFRSRVFSAYVVVIVCYFVTFAAIPLLLPFLLVQGSGLSSAEAGLFLVVIPLLMLIISPITGALSDKLGSWLMAWMGMGVASAGIMLLSRVDASAAAPEVLWRLGVLGVGTGLFLTPAYSAIMGGAPPERRRSVSALIATLRSVGMALGQASAATIFAMQREAYEMDLAGTFSGAELIRQALIGGFQDALLLISAVGVLGALIVFMFGRQRQTAGAAPRH